MIPIGLHHKILNRTPSGFRALNPTLKFMFWLPHQKPHTNPLSVNLQPFLLLYIKYDTSPTCSLNPKPNLNKIKHFLLLNLYSKFSFNNLWMKLSSNHLNMLKTIIQFQIKKYLQKLFHLINVVKQHLSWKNVKSFLSSPIYPPMMPT